MLEYVNLDSTVEQPATKGKQSTMTSMVTKASRRVFMTVTISLEELDLQPDARDRLQQFCTRHHRRFYFPFYGQRWHRHFTSHYDSGFFSHLREFGRNSRRALHLDCFTMIRIDRFEGFTFYYRQTLPIDANAAYDYAVRYLASIANRTTDSPPPRRVLSPEER